MKIKDGPSYLRTYRCLKSVGVLLVALGITSCVGASKRIPDPACEHCYRTESGIPYKTWEAYQP